MVGPGCPDVDYPRPEKMHWHISYANVTTTEVTVSDTSLLAAVGTETLLSFAFIKGLEGSKDLKYGAEIVLPMPGTVTTLETAGAGEEIFFDDSEGSLTSVIVHGEKNVVHIKTASTAVEVDLNGHCS